MYLVADWKERMKLLVARRRPGVSWISTIIWFYDVVLVTDNIVAVTPELN